MRKLGLFYYILALFIGINGAVWYFERSLTTGETLFLRLQPVDPRSLMQGDYIQLQYEIVQQLNHHIKPTVTNDFIIIKRDQQQIASWSMVGDPTHLADDERFFKVKYRQGNWYIEPDTLFFPEGERDEFTKAQYAEVCIQPSGDYRLIGVRDAQLRPIGQPMKRW